MQLPQRRHVREQVEVLEHHADLGCAAGEGARWLARTSAPPRAMWVSGSPST